MLLHPWTWLIIQKRNFYQLGRYWLLYRSWYPQRISWKMKLRLLCMMYKENKCIDTLKSFRSSRRNHYIVKKISFPQINKCPDGKPPDINHINFMNCFRKVVPTCGSVLSKIVMLANFQSPILNTKQQTSLKMVLSIFNLLAP